MEKVNVLSGEIQRTWVWQGKDGRKFHIDLHHDTLTGVRSLALDLDEVPGSMGTTPPFFAGDAHHIPFTVGAERARGAVMIEKAGLLSFRYTCVVNGRPLKATMQALADENEERFRVRIPATAVAYSSKEAAVTWYELCVERQSDGARTVVHRRYREFQNLLEQVHAAFKGHHLRTSIPELPGRQLKLLVDHTDQAFVEERRLLLENAMSKLLSVPHVCAMVPVQVFLGFFDRLKEHSAVFSQRDLGLSITRTRQQGQQGPGLDEAILVTRVRAMQGGLKTRVMVGDTVSKVNGEPVSKYGFDGVAQTISRGLRPIVLHFLQAVDKNPRHEFVNPGEEILVNEVDAPMVMDRGGADQQQQQQQLQQQHARRPSQPQQSQQPPRPPAALPSAGPAPSRRSSLTASAGAAVAAAATGAAGEGEEDDGAERLDKEEPGIERIQRRDPKVQLHMLLEAALAEEEMRAAPAAAAASASGKGVDGAQGAGGPQAAKAGRMSPSAAAAAVAGPLPTVARARLDPLLRGGVKEQEKKPVEEEAPAAPVPAPAVPVPVPLAAGEKALAPMPAPVAAPAPSEEVTDPEPEPAAQPTQEQEQAQAEEEEQQQQAQGAVMVAAPETVEAEGEQAPLAAEADEPSAAAAVPEQAGGEGAGAPVAPQKDEQEEEGGEPEEAAPPTPAPAPAPEPDATEEQQHHQQPEKQVEQAQQVQVVEAAAPAPVEQQSQQQPEPAAGLLRSVSPMAPVEPMEPALKDVITTATMLPPTEDNPFWHSDEADAPPAEAAEVVATPEADGGAVEEKGKEKEAAPQKPQPWQTASAYDFSNAAPHHYKAMLGTASPPRTAAAGKGGPAATDSHQQGQQQQQEQPPPSPYEVEL